MISSVHPVSPRCMPSIFYIYFLVLGFSTPAACWLSLDFACSRSCACPNGRQHHRNKCVFLPLRTWVNWLRLSRQLSHRGRRFIGVRDKNENIQGSNKRTEVPRCLSPTMIIRETTPEPRAIRLHCRATPVSTPQDCNQWASSLRRMNDLLVGWLARWIRRTFLNNCFKLQIILYSRDKLPN